MQPFRQNNYPIWPLYLLIAVMPLAVAGQNIGVVVAFLAMFSFLISEVDKKVQKDEIKEDFSGAPVDLTALLIGTTAYVVWMCVATHLADDNPGLDVATYFVGFLPFMVMPSLARSIYRDFTDQTIEKLWRAVTYVTITSAIIALSQYTLEWHIHVPYFNAHSHRAQGLYSHPLTFAYTSLAIWPMAVIRVINKPRSRSSWFFFLSLIVCLWTSESRTVQLTALGLLLFNVVYYLPRKTKIWAILAIVISVGAITITDNPVTRKFRSTFSTETETADGATFPFDRAAFWLAHWQLVKDAPISGHGIHIPTEVRNRAYNDIGLESFSKKYTAHNMFLQVAAEGGIIGLGLFCFWYFGYIYVSFRNARHSRLAAILGQSLLAIAIAGLTQNAFQDSEVRHVIMLIIILFWCNHDRIVQRMRT